jgi:hypothetical protein
VSVKSTKPGARTKGGKPPQTRHSPRGAQAAADKAGGRSARSRTNARATAAATASNPPTRSASPAGGPKPPSRQTHLNEDGEALRTLRRHLAEAIERFTETFQRIEEDIERLASAASSVPPEAFERVAKVFTAELKTLLGEAPPDDDAVRRAARQAFAEHAWEQRLGTLMDVNDVVGLLEVSRQHVNAMAQQERLISLSQDGRRRFPAWQFAGTTTAQRRCLAAAHHELVAQGGLSPWTAASWMQTDHPELDDQDPVTFLRNGGQCDRLSTVAGRDAARAAQ